MNENYLCKLKQDMELKNFTASTMEDYYRFVKRFLEFTGKEAMSITYADIRKFIFHMKDSRILCEPPYFFSEGTGFCENKLQ